MATPITKSIVGVRLVDQVEDDPETGEAIKNATLEDECPLVKRIEHRPEGALPAVTEKIRYNTQDGAKKVYLIVSFMPVHGVVDGKEVTVERPIEFFIPSNQMSSEQQWVTSTLRMLSLNARGGYVVQALEDMRKVSWDKGPVRYGKNPYGKPMYHDSEVAAIAWAIQQILHRQGFLTQQGKQVPIEDLVRQDKPTSEIPNKEEVAEPSTVSKQFDEGDDVDPVVGICNCGGDLHMRDGCPTCKDCGFSKCG